MFSWVKEQVFEIFIKGYLSNFLKRQKGYVLLISTILGLLQVAVQIVTSPEALHIMTMIISVFGDVAPIKLTPEEVVGASTAIMGLWALINKIIKKAKGLPQVPTMIIEKEALKKLPDSLEAQIKAVAKK